MKHGFGMLLAAGLMASGLCCAIAVAQDTGTSYTPLQPEQSGEWFDPAHAGQGVQLNVVQNAAGDTYVQAVVDAGSIGADPPAWFDAEAAGTGRHTTLPLFQSQAHFGGPSAGVQRVGDLTLDVQACDAITATVAIDGQFPEQFRLRPLIAYRSLECFTCDASGFSPPDPRCGDG
jgi:hypothetical protein